jgi:hypothetical protein
VLAPALQRADAARMRHALMPRCADDADMPTLLARRHALLLCCRAPVSIFSLITDIHAADACAIAIIFTLDDFSFSRHATLSLLDFFDDTAASFEPLMTLA